MNYNPNTISELVKIGMSGPDGRQLLQQYYSNPPEWMTPSEARLFVPIAAERLDRLKEASDKIAAPETTVVEDKVAGLAGLAPQGEGMPMPEEGQPMPEEGAEQGVASLPVPEDMFQEEGMAGGGIIAFDDGGEVQRFQNQGLVSLRSPELRAQLELLKRQYDATPEGTPEKAQLAQAIDAILAADTAAPQTAPAAQAQLTAPAAPASPFAGYPELQAANNEIVNAKAGIADLMKGIEYKPSELEALGKKYVAERDAAGAPFRTKAEASMKKQEARLSEIGKDADLRTALEFFTNLAASPSPFFGVAAGQAGSKALAYYDSIQEKKQRAQAAYDAMDMNYQLARAAEAKGDYDARDKYLNTAKDDKRQAVQAQIKGFEAQGNLAAKQAESFLNLKKLDIDKIRAEADLIRAKAPPDLVQTISYVESRVRDFNNKGLYNDINDGRPLNDAQVLTVTNGYISSLKGGGSDSYKGATLDTAIGNQVNAALINNQEFIDARSVANDPKQTKENRDAAQKTMDRLRDEEYSRQRSLYKKDFDEGTPSRGPKTLLGGGSNSLNPLGLNLPKL